MEDLVLFSPPPGGILQADRYVTRGPVKIKVEGQDYTLVELNNKIKPLDMEEGVVEVVLPEGEYEFRAVNQANETTNTIKVVSIPYVIPK